MIEVCSGSLLDSEADAIVCTVNTKGVMGKGIALACAKRFNGLLDRYAAACEQGEVAVGAMWCFPTGLISEPRLIVCFPTKKHWAQPSRLEWISTGLNALVKTIDDEALTSIAVPALGCGHGGLAWPHVEKMIYESLDPLQLRVELYPPR